MTPRENRIEQIVSALVEVGIERDLAERIVERHKSSDAELIALWHVLEDYAAFYKAADPSRAWKDGAA